MTSSSYLDVLIGLAALVALVVAVIGVASTFYPLYHALVDSRKVGDLELRVLTLEKENSRHDYISDEIANVLYDLYQLINFLKACIELQQEDVRLADEFFDKANSVLSVLEKHFAELGLFSVDDVRRRSVQQSLAARYGDHRTLEIMFRLMEGSIGKGDENLSHAYNALRKRLFGNKYDSSIWTGRPSGGAF
mgnify:CR=1 FL=1